MSSRDIAAGDRATRIRIVLSGYNGLARKD
jgi:hypothetical protein